MFSYVQLFETPWLYVAHQASLSMESSRKEYWSELPFPFPGYLPNTGIKPRSPALQVGFLPSEPPGNVQFQVKWRTQVSVLKHRVFHLHLQFQSEISIGAGLFSFFPQHRISPRFSLAEMKPGFLSALCCSIIVRVRVKWIIIVDIFI